MDRTTDLPLRLWADAGGHARELCGTEGEKCFVLGVHPSTRALDSFRAASPSPSPSPPTLALVLGGASIGARPLAGVEVYHF